MKLQDHQYLYVRSMGKALRVTHIITAGDAAANAVLAQHDELAVVAEFGRVILLADRYDKGISIPKEEGT